MTAADAAKQGLPQWAVGRTAAEGFQLAQQLYQQSLAAPQAPSAPAPQPQQYSAPAYPTGYGQPPAPVGPPTPEEWQADPQGSQQRYNQYVYQQQIAPQFATAFQQNADIALDMIRRDEKDAFGRWEPEIMMNLRGVDRSLWTPANLRKIVGMVKADHLDELAAARAEALVQQRIAAGSLARPSDGGGTSASAPNVLSFDIEALPPNRRDMMESTRLIRNNALTPAFWELCDRMKGPNETREEYAKTWLEDAKKGDVIVSSLGGHINVEDRI